MALKTTVNELEGYEFRGRWHERRAEECLGVRVRVRVRDADLLSTLPSRFLPDTAGQPFCKKELNYTLTTIASKMRGQEEFRYKVRRGRQLVADAFKIEDAVQRLASDVQLRTAANAVDRVCVHSGVVRWRGQAILIPGRSYSGKSTLVLAMVRAGADYYSDEYAVLDRDGYVHPFRRPLTMRTGDGGVSRLCMPATTGGAERIPVGVVVMTGYQTGVRTMSLSRLTPGEGLLALLSNTVAARRKPRQSLGALREVVTRAAVYQGSRGEAEAAAQDILKMLV